MPGEATILHFPHPPEKQQLAPQVRAAIHAGLAQQGLMLKTGTVVDATIIAAPSSTKNMDGQPPPPEMHRPQKGSQRHVGMKTQIGVKAPGNRSMVRRPLPAARVCMRLQCGWGPPKAPISGLARR